MLRPLLLSLTLFSCHTFAEQYSINTLDTGKVTAQGKPVTLLGQGVQLGDTAPQFKVVDSSFSPITLDDYKGKVILISTVPSLDTGICSLQTKHFNELLGSQFPQVKFLTVSTDLPFAQKRFCQHENITNLTTLSDSVWRDFGRQYGLLIKDMGLLTRAIFILNSEHKIVYKQIVANLSHEPDYADIENALKRL